MALKAQIKSLEEVEEQFRSLYTQVGDEYLLDVDDGSYKRRVDEFRTNNIDLNKKIEELSQQAGNATKLQEQLKQFEGLDPEAARKAMETMRNVEEQKLIDAGKIDELLGQRTERMRSDYEGQVNALKSALDESTRNAETNHSRLSEVLIDHALRNAINTVARPKQGAERDIISRGREVWRLNDEGKPQPIGPDGNVLYSKDGASPLTMEEWAQSLSKDASYLFEGSSGGGVPGGEGGGASGGSVISSGDQDALNANIADIAAGKVTVQ